MIYPFLTFFPYTPGLVFSLPGLELVVGTRDVLDTRNRSVVPSSRRVPLPLCKRLQRTHLRPSPSDPFLPLLDTFQKVRYNFENQ